MNIRETRRLARETRARPRETRGDAENGADVRRSAGRTGAFGERGGARCGTRVVLRGDEDRRARTGGARGGSAVDDDAMVVRADAGMSTVCWMESRRWVRAPAVPWFIDQTIGGAVATATNSSLSYGRVVANGRATIVKADGSVAHFAENDESTSPALARFARASADWACWWT